MIKIVKIFIIMILISSFIYSNVFAIDNIFLTSDDWKQDGKTATLLDGEKVVTIGNDTMNNISTSIYNVLFAVGLIVVVAVGAFLGIKFITSGVDEKAEVKEALYPYLISSVIFFGAFGIWRLAILLLGGIL